MEDIHGYELKIGDTVAFVPPRDNRLQIGKITAIRPDKVHIEYNDNFCALNGYEVVKKIMRIAK